jgi:hypothetical protein
MGFHALQDRIKNRAAGQDRRLSGTPSLAHRKGYDWTARVSIIDGEAVVIGPEGFSNFNELRRVTGAQWRSCRRSASLSTGELPLLGRPKVLVRL